jgi:thiamine pyrophosphokinase
MSLLFKIGSKTNETQIHTFDKLMYKNDNKNMMHSVSALIIANGEFPKHSFLQKKISCAKTIICCDGSVQKLLDFGKEPNYIVGDLDSISEKNKIKFADILIHDSSQETNDLTKAVNFCVDKGIKTVEIVGATGYREDHVIGNISLLADYIDILDSVKMFTDYGVFTPISQTTTFESFPQQVVSVFSLTPQTLITSQNLYYPIKNRSFRSWWEGTLNRANNSQFTIAMNEGKIIVFQALSESLLG